MVQAAACNSRSTSVGKNTRIQPGSPGLTRVRVLPGPGSAGFYRVLPGSDGYGYDRVRVLPGSAGSGSSRIRVLPGPDPAGSGLFGRVHRVQNEPGSARSGFCRVIRVRPGFSGFSPPGPGAGSGFSPGSSCCRVGAFIDCILFVFLKKKK